MTTEENQIVSKTEQLESNQTVQKILSGIKINWIELLTNLPKIIKEIIDVLILIKQFIKSK